MKTRLLLPLALLLAAGCSAQAFREFAPPGGKFRVEMPGFPREETREVKTGKLKLYISDVNQGSYSVQWIDLPSARDEDAATQKRHLAQARDKGIENVSGKLIKDEEIKLDGKYPGSDFTADVPSVNGQMHCRLYLVDGRLYQLIVVGRKAFVEGSGPVRFFESFRLQP